MDASLIGLALLPVLAYAIYKLIMPKPLPGIPYSRASMRPFGDIPAMLKSVKETKEATRFILDRVNELQEPIFQIFVEPFGKPWVIVMDSMITEDILAHRNHELDQSSFFAALFIAVAPNSMTNKLTNDPLWKVHRRLMAETMSYNFLHGAVGNHLLSSCADLVELWTEKARLSENRPLDCRSEIMDMLVESVWAVVFGEKMDLLPAQTKHLQNIDALSVTKSIAQTTVKIPTAGKPRSSKLIYALAGSAEIVQKNPLRSLAHKFFLWYDPVLREAVSYRDRYIGEKLKVAYERFSQGSGDTNVRSVIDLVVEKEIAIAEKEGRKAVIDSPTIRDELWVFFLGAYDATGATVQWAMKYLTLHQDVQTQARNELKAAFDDNHSPDTKEIVNAHLPYLEACIYEILRLSIIAFLLARQAKTDVDLLGHHIPKGTQIIMPLQGPGYSQPRLKGAPDFDNLWTGDWDPKELHLFKPSRWIIETEGQIRVEPKAGPFHLFSTGPRACFGRRMAFLDLRLFLTTILLNFELQPIPDNLNEFSAEDVVVHHPQRALIRPKKI